MRPTPRRTRGAPQSCADRKSTRLNSSHLVISYAVFCLKKQIRLPDRQGGPAAARHRRHIQPGRGAAGPGSSWPPSTAASARSAPRPSPSTLFFNDTATTEIYTLSLHDALPISREFIASLAIDRRGCPVSKKYATLDRKSTRLNSSHLVISYAVFCLKKQQD